MSNFPSVPESEIILRRIPNQTYFLGNLANPRINHHNFELRNGEEGISCNRETLMSASELLARPEAVAGSRVARATVQNILALGFQVVEVEDIQDRTNVGHCEIRHETRATFENKQARNQLVGAFTLMNPNVTE